MHPTYFAKEHFTLDQLVQCINGLEERPITPRGVAGVTRTAKNILFSWDDWKTLGHSMVHCITDGNRTVTGRSMEEPQSEDLGMVQFNRSLILKVNNYTRNQQDTSKAENEQMTYNHWMNTTILCVLDVRLREIPVSMWRTRWPCWKTGLGTLKLLSLTMECSWHVGLASLLEVISSKTFSPLPNIYTNPWSSHVWKAKWSLFFTLTSTQSSTFTT